MNDISNESIIIAIAKLGSALDVLQGARDCEAIYYDLPRLLELEEIRDRIQTLQDQLEESI